MTTSRSGAGYGCRVEERISEFVRTWWLESLAVVLALAGVVEGLVLAAPDGVSRGPGWFLPFVVALMAIPLLFVKRFPFAAPVATVLVADLIAFATTGRLVTDGFVAIFLLILASWLFGRLDRRSSVMGLLLLLVTVVVVDSQADKMTGAAIVFPWIFFTTFWAASVFVTARGGQVQEAEDRAEQLAIEQETAAMRAVAEERQRIARELHDVIAHSVSVMTVQAGAVRRLLLPEQERERQALEVVESTGREALTEMRRLVGLLREQGTMPEFAPQPSLRTLDILIGTVREAGLEVDLDVQGDGARAAAGRRPLRLPARPGGSDEHAQVRRPGACLGHAAVARRRARARGGEQRSLGGGDERIRARPRRDAGTRRAVRRYARDRPP